MLPKGLGNLGQLGNLMKSAMEMKERMEEIKESLADHVIDAETGGGMVKVQMNGKQEVISIKIDPTIIDPENPEVVETMVQAAINEATHKTQEYVKEKMSELTQGMNIPGLTD